MVVITVSLYLIYRGEGDLKPSTPKPLTHADSNFITIQIDVLFFCDSVIFNNVVMISPHFQLPCTSNTLYSPYIAKINCPSRGGSPSIISDITCALKKIKNLL